MLRTLPMLGFVCLIAGCTGTTKPKPDEKVLEPAVKEKADTVIEDYRKNAAAGDMKYKDKLVDFTGKVAGIGKAPLYGHFVGFGTSVEGVDSYDIMCFLDESAVADAAKLNKGDTVTIRGMCTGQEGGIKIVVKRCAIIKPGN